MDGDRRCRRLAMPAQTYYSLVVAGGSGPVGRITPAGADRAIMRRNRNWFRYCGRSSSEVTTAKPPVSSAFPLGFWCGKFGETEEQ